MQTGIFGRNLIKDFEKLRLKAYKPHADDVWTIGWGHTMTARKGLEITRDTAQKLFEQDLRIAEDAVNDAVDVPLNQNQFDALVSFTFNVGISAFRRSTLVKKLNAGDFDGAPDEFPRWKYSAGKVLRGLVRRRTEERLLFEGEM